MNDTEVVIDPFYLFVSDWARVASIGFVILAFLLGVPGNILVVLVHAKIPEKLVTDWMIFYLAVCDLLSLAVLPNFVIQLLGYWPMGFPEILCKIHLLHSNAISLTNFIVCSCTALERFFKVCFSKDLFTTRQVQLIWIPITIVCYGCGVFSFLTVGHNPHGHCMVDLEQVTLAAIAYGIVMITALVSSVVMAFSYLCIGIYLLKKMREISKSKSNESFTKRYKITLQMTKMLAVVTVVFLISANTPYVTGFVLQFHPVTSEPGISLVFLLTNFFVINNFINPYLYLKMSSSFRKRALDVVRQCCSCCNSKYAVKEDSSTEGKDTKATTDAQENNPTSQDN